MTFLEEVWEAVIEGALLGVTCAVILLFIAGAIVVLLWGLS